MRSLAMAALSAMVGASVLDQVSVGNRSARVSRGIVIPGSVRYEGGKQVPYRVDGSIQDARLDRRSRVTTARQQRKARKMANRLARDEAAFSAQLAAHEANMDWQEEESAAREDSAYLQAERDEEMRADAFG